MPQLLWQGRKELLVLLSVAVLAGCASRTRGPAPIEDRSALGRGAQQASVANTPPTVVATPVSPGLAEPPADVPRLPLGAENAGKPGYYTIRPGDTLIRIALDTGNNWRDIARWNNIDNPNLIEVGQVLRIVAPVATASGSGEGGTTRPVAPPAVAGSPVPPPGGSRVVAPVTVPPPAGSVAQAPTAPAAPAPAAPVPPPAPAPAPSPAPAPAATAPAPSAPVPAADEAVAWAWPAPGNTAVLAGFDEARNKGVDIAGKQGDPVIAAADGRVVYAGAGLRGYGNLVILKHNNTYLTAYAHNQTLLVKEDQVVRKGQKIAEMGSTDADRVKLHFEIRRQGKPVDPARYLGSR
ncbi:peptidoglycan DD-metalloendopeptidase family protein [Ramlibacter rhizophilus]|uniref:LysM peptidoglycan-binding domain-containing protein n=1 Tax=Ramlibacter rhizophilus TaxID=1781167 RepID=A0A4Z0BFZ8_9BURK|nr:peptidoglycan DD-metalloendopeptidase family protein [Ramlibacter rhizophilus]TFY96808.1 LysM peptidoglycan-binding domain-containing protein [Ramlibacter rhizophilus]